MPYLTLPLREAANMPDTNMATINSNPESFQRPDLQKAPYLTFKVVNSKQPGAPFKMRSSTSLGKVMDAYCERLGIERANTHFLYDDVRVNKRDTPASIGMVEGDVIEALSEHLQKVQAAAQIEQLSGKMEQLQVVLADDKKEMINILVKDWNDHIVYFKMKPSTSLGKLMNAFCEREGLDRSNVRFLWEGSRISDADTPDELDIKDLNTIDVYPEQVGGGSPDPEEKPKEEPAKKHISIKVKDDQGNEVYFKIKHTTPFDKVMNAYSEKQGQNVDSLRFFFDNIRIQKTDTPASLDMEEDDSVDVHQQQLGGDGSPNAAAESKLEEDGQVTNLNVKVKDQNNNELFFKIKRTTALKKVMDAYCNRESKERNTVRFLFEGMRVNDADTPASLEMEDGNNIEVFLEQQGGDGTPKPEEEQSTHISVKVKDQAEQEIFFKIKRTTKLSKVMDAYCQRQGKTREMCRFLFDGLRVNNDDTPEKLEMEDGNIIDVFLEQQGGAQSLF